MRGDCLGFVYIGGIVDYNCLNFLFIILDLEAQSIVLVMMALNKYTSITIFLNQL